MKTFELYRISIKGQREDNTERETLSIFAYPLEKAIQNFTSLINGTLKGKRVEMKIVESLNTPSLCTWNSHIDKQSIENFEKRIKLAEQAWENQEGELNGKTVRKRSTASRKSFEYIHKPAPEGAPQTAAVDEQKGRNFNQASRGFTSLPEDTDQCS